MNIWIYIKALNESLNDSELIVRINNGEVGMELDTASRPPKQSMSKTMKGPEPKNMDGYPEKSGNPISHA
jgi:hypothetical protein